MQGKSALVVYHGVSGVAAALIPHYHVVMAGEVVYHAALALIAPVNAYNRAVCHIPLPPKLRAEAPHGIRLLFLTGLL